MPAPEPTFPGAYPATPVECSNEPDPFIEAAKSYALDLSEKTKPYLPEAVAKHLPEKIEREIKDKTNPGSHDENGQCTRSYFHSDGITEKQSNQIGDDRSQQLEEEERTADASEGPAVVSATNPKIQDDDENIYQYDGVVPVDPDAKNRPKDCVACEQEHEEETSPSIFISNCGNGSHCGPAAPNDVEPGTSGSSGGALPVSGGVAEDQLLADYLGPHEPTVRAENERNAEELSAPTDSTTPAQSGPRVRDFGVEEEAARMSINTSESDEPSTSATVVIDSINEPYKPHRLENIQEKTRNNRLPPLALTSSPPDAASRTGTGSVFAKFRRGRRSSSATSTYNSSELRKSHGGPEQDTIRSLDEIEDNLEQAKRVDHGDSPQPLKVGLMTKVKGEIKIAMGVLQRNKGKVEEGKRMIEKS